MRNVVLKICHRKVVKGVFTERPWPNLESFLEYCWKYTKMSHRTRLMCHEVQWLNGLSEGNCVIIPRRSVNHLIPLSIAYHKTEDKS